MVTEKVKQLPTLPSLSEEPCVVGLLCVKEQQVLFATMMMHQRQHHTETPWFLSVICFTDWRAKE